MAQLRKTRIVSTLGPACNDVSTMKDLLKAGINVARFNFSHGDHEEQAERIRKIRQASQEMGIPIALMMDTKGPEIRTGLIEGGGEITLIKGDQITLTTEQIEGNSRRLSISCEQLTSELRQGNHIFIADGI